MVINIEQNLASIETIIQQNSNDIESLGSTHLVNATIHAELREEIKQIKELINTGALQGEKGDTFNIEDLTDEQILLFASRLPPIVLQTIKFDPKKTNAEELKKLVMETKPGGVIQETKGKLGGEPLKLELVPVPLKKVVVPVPSKDNLVPVRLKGN